MNDPQYCPECNSKLTADNVCPKCTVVVKGTGVNKPEREPPVEETPADRSALCRRCGGLLTPEGTCFHCDQIGTGIATTKQILASGTKVCYFGEYVLLGRAGSAGGMGLVYRAKQSSTGRTVALKMLRGDSLRSADAVERFRAEVRAATSLDHPAILPVYEVGEHQGRHYFTMKYVREGSLGRQMEAGRWVVRPGDGRSRQQEAARLMEAVARGVHHAHQRGILHRDLKPGNVLVDAQGQPYVTDFGLAKFIEQDMGLTVSQAVMGTPQYMSPEQAEGQNKNLTTVSDVFSLGVVLYELLTGRKPFQGDSLGELLNAIREKDPVQPRMCNRDVDRDLETICLKCLEKDPKNRYGSADGLADDLRRWQQGEPILARPATAWERSVKWCRRKPAIAALSLSLGFVLLAGIGAVLWQWREAEGARAVAVEKAREETRARAAEATAKEKAENLSTELQYERAEQFLLNGDAALAVASLASALRNHPTNHYPAQRIISILNQRPFPHPVPLEKDRHRWNRASFNADGTRVLTASGGKVVLWDATNATLVRELIGNESVSFADFSPDGRFVMARSSAYNTTTNRLLRWDSDAGRREDILLETTNKFQIVHPRKGQRFVVLDEAGWQAWDYPSGKPITRPINCGTIDRIALSPDISRVVTKARSGTRASLWDGATGALITDAIRHKAAVLWACFSPDGRRFASAGADGTVMIWDSEAGKPVAPPLVHSNRVDWAEFDPSGQRLVTRSEQVACVWDVQTGRPILPSLWHSERVNMATFSHDGQKILTAASDNAARVWDAATGRPLTPPLQHRLELGASLSPDDRYVLTFSVDSTARIWEVGTGDQVVEALRHTRGVKQAEYNPGRNQVLTVSWDGQAQLWNLAANPSRSLVLQHNAHRMKGGFIEKEWVPEEQFMQSKKAFEALSAEEKELLLIKEKISLQDKELAEGMWRSHPLQTALYYRHLYTRAVNAAHFSPDDREIITACSDGTVRRWDARSGVLLGEPFWHRMLVASVSYAANGQELATVDAEGTVRMWDPVTGRKTASLKTHVTNHILSPPGYSVVSPDGKLGVSWFREVELVTVGDVRSGKEVGQLKVPYGVRSVRFDRLGERVVIATSDGTVAVWNVLDRRPVTTLPRHNGRPNWADFSPDGARVISASDDGTARVWDARSGQPVSGALRHNGNVRYASISPDLQKAVTASDDGTARIWDTRSWRLVAMLNHNAAVNCAAFSPDSLRVATASRDRTAKVWDAHAGKPLSLPLQHEGEVIAVEFNSQGDRILTASDDGTARVWDVPMATMPAPSWLPDLVEAIVQVRMDEQLTPTTVPLYQYRRLQSEFTDQSAAEECSRWIPWLPSGVIGFLSNQIDILSTGFDIPVRPKNTPSSLIDLSFLYTQSLRQNSVTGAEGNNLAALPTGIQTFAGTRFDIRGMVQLSSTNEGVIAAHLPVKAEGIRVNQKCRRLRLLHGTGFKVTEGQEVARMVVNFANGQRIEVPFKYGIHLRDWWEGGPSDPSTNAPGSVVVWTGSNECTASWSRDGQPVKLRLFLTTWENPYPGIEVHSVDYVSAMTESCPFLIAITAEP